MRLIVIVDDRATNRSIFARLAAMIADDVVVEAFEDPLDALEWLEGSPADLVITDYRMPRVDGAEFTRRLRASPGGADVPVIVVTAYDDRSFRLRAMEAGATDFLQSPVDHFEFVTRARNLLALPRQGRGTRADAAAPRRAAAIRAQPRPGLDDIPALICAADGRGRCLFVNARQAREAGATPEDLVGQDIARVLGEERAALSRARDREVLDTGRDLPAYWEAGPWQDAGRRLLTAKAPLRDSGGAIIGVVTTTVEVHGPPRDGGP
jgi:CheY-like chemotaxis protein